MTDLYDLMDRKGYSIRGLADASEVSVSTIENILRGYKTVTPGKPLDIQAATMRKIAKTLEVEILEVKQFAEAIERKRVKEDREPVLNSLPV